MERLIVTVHLMMSLGNFQGPPRNGHAGCSSCLYSEDSDDEGHDDGELPSPVFSVVAAKYQISQGFLCLITVSPNRPVQQLVSREFWPFRP